MSTDIPRLTRRDFFQIGGLGVATYSLLPMLKPLNVHAKEKVEPRGGAETCILLFLQGGPSQLETFSAKEGPWTPPDFDIRTVHSGLKMPAGLLPKLSERADKFAVLQSLEAWEAEHARGTYYLQAARLLSPARLQEIPSVGSVIAYETAGRAKDSDFLPSFVSMNMDTSQLVGSGMLPSNHAPMAMYSNAPPPFVLRDEERYRFEIRRQLLGKLDRDWREEDTHRGRIFSDLDHYYQSAYPLLDNPKASPVFAVEPEDSVRYGSTDLGNACVIARNLVAEGAGTRFIFIAHNGWDLHDKLYDKTAKGSQYKQCAELDPALSGLLDDLEAQSDKDGRPLIDKTLVLCMGEFGRTPGTPNLRNGRDHYRYAAVALLAGAGVKGGQALGATDEEGARVVEPGWHRNRSIYPEDVLVTLYSVMGIDWTKGITKTPSGRVFEYIENISPKGIMQFGEIKELFA